MRTLIIEDEAIAARSLALLLAEYAPELQLEPALPSVAAGIARLAQPPRPELMFMDVHLADGLCFDILEAVPSAIPVIFTTAYDQFALRAFEVFGIDYLLKPLRPERLLFALNKVRQLKRSGLPAAPPGDLAGAFLAASQRYRERFLVAAGAAMVSIAVERIAYFQKDLLVRLITREGRAHVLAQSLDELELQLDPTRFFRANRQTIVQVDAIAQLQRGFKGKLELQLKPPAPDAVVVSQERAAALRAWLDR